MKSYLIRFSIVIMVFICGFQAANAIEIHIKGKQAKQLYNSLTGSAVQQEGAAGHSYRRGKDVLCRYTSADISQNGHSLPQNASCRYACTVKFNHNGHASPGINP